MLIASGEVDGRKVLILGLDEENMRRLRNDEPIQKCLGDVPVPGLEDWTVSVLGPEDMARFVAQVGAAS